MATIANPETGNQIKIGGAVYKRLVKEGKIDERSPVKSKSTKTGITGNDELDLLILDKIDKQYFRSDDPWLQLGYRSSDKMAIKALVRLLNFRPQLWRRFLKPALNIPLSKLGQASLLRGYDDLAMTVHFTNPEWEVLRDAAKYNRLRVIEYALALNPTIEELNSALHDAVNPVSDFSFKEPTGLERFPVIKLLIEAGADPKEESIINNAAAYQSLGIVRYLVEIGAPITAKTIEKTQGAGRKETMDFLVSKVGRPDLSEQLPERAKLGHWRMIGKLLDEGADVHYKDDEALILAVRGNHPAVVKVLVDKGANVNARNGGILVEATRSGNLALTKYLIKHGADLHLQDDKALIEAFKWRDSPFFIKGYNDYEGVIRYLVKHGANLHAGNDELYKETSKRRTDFLDELSEIEVKK